MMLAGSLLRSLPGFQRTTLLGSRLVGFRQAVRIRIESCKAVSRLALSLNFTASSGPARFVYVHVHTLFPFLLHVLSICACPMACVIHMFKMLAFLLAPTMSLSSTGTILAPSRKGSLVWLLLYLPPSSLMNPCSF